MGVPCSVYIATCLDGFIAQHPDDDYGYRRFHDSIDKLVMERKTYETALVSPNGPEARAASS